MGVSVRHYRDWAEVPADLATESDLRFAGLEPQGAPVAFLDLPERQVALYLRAQATQRASTQDAASRARDKGTSSRVSAIKPRTMVVLPAAGHLAQPARAKPSSEATLAQIHAWLQEDTVVVDSETTGIGYSAEVIELAVVSVSGEVVFDTLVRPRAGRVPTAASAVHGLTMRDLRDAPTFAEVYDALLTVLRKRRILAWNAPFDERMVRQSARAWALTELPPRFDCAMRAYAHARGLSGGRAKLERAGRDLGLLGVGAQEHRAADDARLTLKVLQAIASSG